METRYQVEPEPYGDIVATPAGVRTSLDDPERKANPAGLSVTLHLMEKSPTASFARFIIGKKVKGTLICIASHRTNPRSAQG